MATVRPSNPQTPPPTWWRSRLRSFGYAAAGVADLVRTQPHARFHLLATVAVAGAALGFGVSPLEAAVLALAIGLVWCAEAMNTAVELLVDLVHPDWARPAGRVKDMAAGAVLLAAAAAAFTGAFVLLPRIYQLLGGPT